MLTARIAAVGVIGLAALAGAGCNPSALEIERLRADKSRLEAEVKRLTDQLEAAERTEATLRGKLQVREDALDEAESRMADLSRHVESAKLAATAAQAQFEEAAGKLAAAEARISELQGALEQATEEARELAERYRTDVESLREEIANLQAQLAAALKALEAEGLRGLLPKRDRGGE